MKAICILDIRDMICQTLDREFGYEVYADMMKQGFHEPCFFVEIIHSSQKRIGFNRHKRLQKLCVHFFPADDGDMSASIMKTAELLYGLLEYLNVNGSLCRGTGMNHKSDAESLHFFVDYNYHLIEQPQDIPKMDTFSHEGGIKL